MHKLYKNISIASKAILTVFILLIILSFYNPFSDLKIRGETKTLTSEAFAKIDWKYHTSIDKYDNQYKISKYKFILNKDKKPIKLISFIDHSLLYNHCNNNQIGYIDDIKSNNIKCTEINEIINPNIHPMNFFSSTENNYHILGTIDDSSPRKGLDRLSKLSKSLFSTFTMSLTSMVTFILFGIITALNIAYFNNRTTKLFKLSLQAFQCVPILLWILVIIVVIGYSKSLDEISKTYLYFLFFGLFSSPALANLIIEKINYLKNKDFIVALKLLGLSDYRIILGHMYEYCKPVIVFQAAYIIAHTFFLDITLCWIEQMSNDTQTLGYYLHESKRNYSLDLLIIIPLFLSITYLFYDIASTYKIISENDYE